jgi:hypothetical protein
VRRVIQMKKGKSSLSIVGISIICFAGSVFGVTAVGAALIPPIETPAGVSAPEGFDSVPAKAPVYPLNESGLTYGSLSDAISVDTEPDLIFVAATNGKLGYAYRTDLNEADGTTAALTMKTPEERLAWQTERDAAGTIFVPVYEVDGLTAIGEFPVTPGGHPGPVLEE